MMMTRKIFLLCGIPASGKSTWARNFFDANFTANWVSRDKIRFSLLKDGEDYFAHENKVWRRFVNQCVDSIENFEYTIIDQTNLNWASRRKIIKAIQDRILETYEYEIIPVYFLTDYDTCVKRNSKREGRRRVPEYQMKRMRDSFTHPEFDPFHYSTLITVVDDSVNRFPSKVEDTDDKLAF